MRKESGGESEEGVREKERSEDSTIRKTNKDKTETRINRKIGSNQQRPRGGDNEKGE